MSIIEKALDKSEEKEEKPREKGRADPIGEESRRSRPIQEQGPATEDGNARDPLPKLVDEYRVPSETEPAAKTRIRPDFPRKTVKETTVDVARLDAAGIITPDSKRTGLVEQFRSIKRPLLMKASHSSDARVPNGNVVLVTSAIPGEGKTFTAVNLAMSIAMELDHTVLLIDADTAKADISRVLGIEESEGLIDYLAEPKRALSEFLVKTNIASLSVLPAGRSRVNVTELLASEQMRQLVDEFGRRYPDRIVIIDSPPLLAASGAGVLTHLVGQIVFVVEAIRTPQSAVEEALENLRTARNVGLVLNKSRGKDGLGYQYGSSYYVPGGGNR